LLFKRREKEGNIVEIPCDSKEFKKIIEENKVVVVDFWAKWCFPCLIYARSFKKAANRLVGRALFAKVNVGECYSLARKYNIFGVPTTMIFVNGKPKRRILGPVSDKALVRIVEEYL